MNLCPDCGGPLPEGGDCPRCATQVPTRTGSTLGDPKPGRSPSPSPLPAQGRIAHFAIQRELGAGGMGVVYLARDERMKRDVALKVMARSQLSEKAGKRFAQEAWIAGRLDHPNLVRVYERGEAEGLHYFSMELVEGGSLADVVQKMRRSGRDDGLGLEFTSSGYIHWAMRTLIDAARGLDFAHRQGIVHRDIKPMNLLFSRKLAAVKIADFGLATDSEATRVTTVGTVMGTLAYMAPEQMRGEIDKIDARTDIYALGATAFELLTLQLPYSGRTQQLYMSQVLSSAARGARKLNMRVSRDLETVLRKALEKEPKDRYATAGALADDLENVLHLRPITAKPPGMPRRVFKWVRRKPVHALLAATLAIAVPVIGLVAVRAVGERRAARAARLADLLDEARWLGERREFDASLERAAAALELDPGNPMALRHRAMGRFLQADATADPARVRTLREQALSDASAVAAALPKAAWPRSMKAYMLTVLNRKAEAEGESAAAAGLRSAGFSDDDLGEEARLALARGESNKALELYSELITRHPDSVVAISSRANLYEELGNPEKAVEDYRVAVGVNPRYDLALIDLARLSTARGAFDDAQAYLDRALAIDPGNAVALETRGHFLARRAQVSASRGDKEEARRLLGEAEEATRQALARSDRLVWAELNIATFLADRAKLADPVDPNLAAQALEGYRKVLDRFPDRPPGGQQRDVYDAARRNTCDAQIALRRLEEALATCSRIAQQNPDQPVAQYNLAGVYALLGRTADALAALEADLRLGDTDWEYLAADPWFEKLRPDPRFQRILSRMKLAKKP
jgi:serine/threonine protein kinase/Flp pilus assembly protein TadD